jgi:hypothetical protein
MNTLSTTAIEMLAGQAKEEQLEAEHRFCEQLAVSRSGEIISMLDTVLADHFMEFPVWARMLAFRLACLLEPGNAAIRRRAAADLRLFGPDWDAQADALDLEAARIESNL